MTTPDGRPRSADNATGSVCSRMSLGAADGSDGTGSFGAGGVVMRMEVVGGSWVWMDEGGSVTSGLAWLDSSREDQQRIRDLLNLFSETESRDELGIGQVRDAF